MRNQDIVKVVDEESPFYGWVGEVYTAEDAEPWAQWVEVIFKLPVSDAHVGSYANMTLRFKGESLAVEPSERGVRGNP